MAQESTLLPFYLRMLVPLLVLFTTVSKASQDNQDVLGVSDLDRLVEIFSGEFNNSAQNQNDTASGATGDDLHFLIQRFHVPVKIPSLQEAAGPGTVTRQLYLEQYYNNGPTPRQRIFNVILKGGQIEMELRQAVNASLTEAWKSWRENRSVFEDINSDDLQFDPECNVRWSRSGACQFTSRTQGNNCVFTFFGQQVYIESEVNVSQSRLVQDERFVSVADGSKVSGSNTPYVYDKVASIPPLPADDNMASKCYPRIDLTCRLLKVMVSFFMTYVLTGSFSLL